MAKVIDLLIQSGEEKIYSYVWINDDEKEVSVRAKITGDNASVTILAIFLGTKNNTVIFNTDVTHIGKNTKSLTLIRSVFLDRSVFNNDGMVRINNGAKNTNGYFDSKVLLFDDAKGRSVPSLEIDENEVKAGHGSTIGRPDENQLFYLQSRGLSEKEAERLIISGFFDPIITMMPKENQKTIKKRVSDQLKKHTYEKL